MPPPPPLLWNDLGNVIPINPSGVNDDEAGNVSDTELPREEEGTTTWHDVALSIAAELMRKAREEVYDKLGYSTSAVSDIPFVEFPSWTVVALGHRELQGINF